MHKKHLIKFSIHDKNSHQSDTEGTYLNTIEVICDTLTTKIKLNDERLKAFLLYSGIRQGYPLSPFLFNIVLEVLATAIRKQKEIKGIQGRRDDVKFSLYARDMMLYIENSRLHTKTIRIDK